MDRAVSIDSGVALSAAHRGWIHSPAFDLAFFILPAGVAFALAAIGREYPFALPALTFAAAYLLGVPHYLASFAFFLGDENRAHARRFWALFYAGPVLICAVVALLYAAKSAWMVHAVLFVWNVYHVATQSSGVLSLYRRLSGGAHAERIVAHRMILFSNAAMAFWNLEPFAPLNDPLSAAHPALPRLLFCALALAALAFAIAYVRLVRRRGFPLSAAEGCCLATGLALFTPYLWLDDANFATLIMLAGHFVQYLAIVWLLNRRKYAPSDGSRAQRGMARAMRSWPSLAAFVVVSGCAFYLFDRGSQAMNAYVVFMVAFNCLALVHFYIDGLIWAFRNPYIRDTVGPHLTLQSHRLR